MSNKKINKDVDIPNFVKMDDVDSDAFIKDIKSSLAKQVNDSMESEGGKKGKKRRKKKKSSKLLRSLFVLLLSLVVLFSLLIFTKPGKSLLIGVVGDFLYGRFDFQTSKNSSVKDVIKPIGDRPSGSNDDFGNVKTNPHVINILLIGVEEFEGAKNTDTMIIATMNTKDNSLKLTSLMRDLYVEIPGYKDNRLNSAYPRGGIDLLYDTIEQNFDLKIDGYCLVNFDAFEKIIDKIGGVEITLTAKEAKYLKTTNYISKKKNRNVVEGKQLMNGNQALGYCRIRKVPTATESSDFGRTQRQRIVLQAAYDKLRSKNIFSMILLMDDILKDIKITTDISQKDFKLYLEEAVSLKVKDIETLRIPSNGSYKDAKVQIGSRKQEVLQPKDWDATRKEVHDFIYGAE